MRRRKLNFIKLVTTQHQRNSLRRLFHFWEDLIPYFRMIFKIPCKLPDFMIIGMQKAATTSLMDAISSSPQVREEFRKEIHYYNRKFHMKSMKWYIHNFVDEANLLVGEATPEYSNFEEYLVRIKNTNPNVKLIYIIRNQEDRAKSHFKHEKRLGRTNLSFSEAINAEEKLLNRMIGYNGYHTYTTDMINYEYLGFRDKGEYQRRVDWIIKHFPKGNYLILDYEDLLRNFEKEKIKLQNFLGIELTQALPWHNKNP